MPLKGYDIFNMRFDIVTIFPEIFNSYFNESILKRAQQNKKITIKVHDLRTYTSDKHRTVDDRPYGGGPGMVLKVEPIYKCLKKIRKKNSRVLLMSAKGKILKQKKLQQLTKEKQVIIICGHYEGIDERVMKFVDEEVSIGGYVLTGGELPAMIMVDGIARLLPGVLGKDESSKEESYSDKKRKEYPQYTRPEAFKGLKVPKILLSGNHQKIQEWRDKKRKA